MKDIDDAIKALAIVAGLVWIGCALGAVITWVM